jgi:hypothetical protein
MPSKRAFAVRAGIFTVETLIAGYRAILSPLLIGHCKFVPTCSEYMRQAVHEWGVRRGVLLGLKRLARCRPFSVGGIDPVPQRKPPGAWVGHASPQQPLQHPHQQGN